MSRFTRYELAKASWLELNPEATPTEVMEAMQRIARKFGV